MKKIGAMLSDDKGKPVKGEEGEGETQQMKSGPLKGSHGIKSEYVHVTDDQKKGVRSKKSEAKSKVKHVDEGSANSKNKASKSDSKAKGKAKKQEYAHSERGMSQKDNTERVGKRAGNKDKLQMKSGKKNMVSDAKKGR